MNLVIHINGVYTTILETIDASPILIILMLTIFWPYAVLPEPSNSWREATEKNYPQIWQNLAILAVGKKRLQDTVQRLRVVTTSKVWRPPSVFYP